MTQYKLALLMHLLGVTLLAAGMGAAAAGLERARRREHPAEVAVLLSIAKIGVALVGVGSIVLVSGGLWLLKVGAYDLRDGWLFGSLGLFVLSALLGTLGGRRPKRARLHAEWLLQEGAQGDTMLRRLLDDPLSLILNYTSALLMTVVLALMVVKP